MKAFPTAADNGHSENQDGMDLRDYFAAKALEGHLSNPNVNTSTKYCDLALVCYEIADNMMWARTQEIE